MSTPVISLSPAKRAAFQKVRGLWIAIPTPFEASGAIDEQGLARSVDYYVDGLGVDGIFCGGVMGEFWAMTVAERRRGHELVVNAARGRVPLMAHVGHHALADAIDLSRHAAEIGIDFAIAMNPYFPINPSDDLVRAYYRHLSAASDIPLFLFNTSYSGYTISPELIAELADLETVCGIKNPKPIEHLLRVKEMVGDRIVVCDASEADWLGLHLEHGFPALMSTPALAMFQTPDRRPVHDYTALADGGDLEAAWKLHATLAGERAAFGRWMHDRWLANKQGAIPIAELKAWLGLMGLPQGPVRPPLVPLPDHDVEALRSELDRLGLLDAIAQ
ncbi:MAG: dihydrodipicolinate synthase family protein [Acidimicrobiales bacterium]